MWDLHFKLFPWTIGTDALKYSNKSEINSSALAMKNKTYNLCRACKKYGTMYLSLQALGQFNPNLVLMEIYNWTGWWHLHCCQISSFCDMDMGLPYCNRTPFILFKFLTRFWTQFGSYFIDLPTSFCFLLRFAIFLSSLLVLWKNKTPKVSYYSSMWKSQRYKN